MTESKEEKNQPDANKPQIFRRELPELENQLYARKESDLIKRRAEEISRLGIRQEQVVDERNNALDAPRVYRDVNKERVRRGRKVGLIALMIAGVLLLVAAVVAGFVWYRLRVSVNANQLHLNMTAAEAVTSGDVLTYVVEYGNDSYVDWLDVELEIEVPVGFQVTSVPEGAELSGQRYVIMVGNLDAGEMRRVELAGRLIGELSSSAKAQAKMYASPENYQKVRFDKSAIVSTTVIAVPLDLALEAPTRAVPGEQVLIKVSATNTSEEPINDGYLQLSIPAGMQAVVEDPQFSPDFSVIDSRWTLPVLGAYETVTRQAVMTIDGQTDDKRILEIALGVKSGDNSFVQQTQSAIVVLTTPELQLVQKYNGSADPLVVAAGERVTGEIKYQNTGRVALQDVVVTAKIEGEAFNPSSLRLQSGAYDTNTRTITWTAASLPQLAVLQPQSEGIITYEFLVKELGELAQDDSVENSVIVVTVNIDSPTMTNTGQQASSNNRRIISLKSNLTLDLDAFYDDGRLGILSTGPVPPKVGEETTYTVRVRAGSALNALGDVRASVVLADGVRYTGAFYKTAGEISFNERTGEMVWNLAQVQAGAGRVNPAAELYFQVGVTPAENQRREYVRLVNRAEATGMDLFTESSLSAQGDDLPTTQTASGRDGLVQ